MEKEENLILFLVVKLRLINTPADKEAYFNHWIVKLFWPKMIEGTDDYTEFFNEGE
jgi:hypothetical protein